MGKESYIGGDYIETTGGSAKNFAGGSIENSSLANQFTQNGLDSGVKYGVNEDAPIIEGIKEDVFLYLIFFIDEDHKGKLMISEGSQTRLKNIKKQSWYDDKKHKAFSIPIQSVDEILDQIPQIIKKHSEGDKKRVMIAEIGIFSHAGGDGPISYNKQVKICPEPQYKSQMLMCGWEQINVEWTTQAKFVFYGCNTGNTNKNWNNFAKNISSLSNFKNVEVWGQSTSSFPSFYPDYRVTSAARSTGDNGFGWDIRGNTYQVAGNPGEGWKAMSFSSDKNNISKEDLRKSEFPKANPLNVYKNGLLIKSTHQGVFNDHR
ncbi:hypothetical protein MQX03_14415 [Chryseobacterium aahli]|uniref:hypothetical protein n=1 Tax=Chryseobacterium TaxID=59732 RepID=UPI000F0CC29E|nr:MULTISPECIES: hypothetical protein [Chryseobacterium]AYN01635.1 hypothetical protein EAG08_16205 [Chryseobacterium sp. 3008163]MCI3938393.1 hypothetical protein [Chryseobacterium aahli]